MSRTIWRRTGHSTTRVEESERFEGRRRATVQQTDVSNEDQRFGSQMAVEISPLRTKNQHVTIGVKRAPVAFAGLTSSSMKIAIYARVSKKNSRQDTQNQLAQLRQFAQVQGWTIVHEYIDRATGKHSAREQFQKLFADASQRKFDLVLFWSLDRFSREGVLETLNHLQRLLAYGVG